jgi:hypothetical protein
MTYDELRALAESHKERGDDCGVLARAVLETENQAEERAYIAGVNMTRRLLRLQLGLAVPGDSE